MIEQILLQSGALGIVAFVVYDQRKTTNALIENNTKALQKVFDVIQKCKKRKNKI